MVEQGDSADGTERAFAQRDEAHLGVNDLDQFLSDELEEFVSGGSIGALRWNATKTFLARLFLDDCRRVIKATKEGLREAIAKYVKENGNGLVGARFLYMTNLSKFWFPFMRDDGSVQNKVSALGLKVHSQEVAEYSGDVGNQFGCFIYNASNKRFFQKFGENVVYVVDDYELPNEEETI